MDSEISGELPEPLAALLQDSEAFFADVEQFLHSLAACDFDKRELGAMVLCQAALEHGLAFRGLFEGALFTSGVAILRVQFEALLRAAWLLHVATDEHVERMVSPLSLESEQGAKNLPGLHQMIEAIEKRGPRGAGQMFRRFYDRLARGLNSFVHAGIHVVHRNAAGFPPALLCDLLKSSNAVVMLTLIVIGELTADENYFRNSYPELYRRHANVLPELEPFPQGEGEDTSTIQT